jgi:signal transduction histidine kinase
MKPQAEARKIAFSVSSPEELPALSLDKRRIAQVLTNLVGNAFKHTPEGGSVAVTAQAGAGEVMVEVRDTGEGIPAPDLAKIFEQFYQVESHASKKEGLGLGLSIAQEIIKAHDGLIQAQSDGPGRGSRFWFSLPALKP